MQHGIFAGPAAVVRAHIDEICADPAPRAYGTGLGRQLRYHPLRHNAWIRAA